MSLNHCIAITNECISDTLQSQLKEELKQEGDVVMVLTLDTLGNLKLGFPKRSKLVRAEQVLRDKNFDKVTPIVLQTASGSLSGYGDAGGWPFGFICE